MSIDKKNNVKNNVSDSINQGVQTDINNFTWSNFRKEIEENKNQKESEIIRNNLMVDMVITYVDGSDPEYLNKKNEFLKKSVGIEEFNPLIRSVSIGEIKHCVNCVLKYIPWIRKIYIVTDNQIPPLSPEVLQKITIVDHKEIIEAKYLPTFNSDVIESCLHKIPDLSEIFLYNNDDCFHFSSIKREDIFDVINGSIKLKIRGKFRKENFINNSGEYSQRMLLTAKFLKEKFPDMNLIHNHHTKILRKSMLKIIEKNFKLEIDSIRKNNFRKNDYFQYLFFVTNLDNYLNKNILIENLDNVYEKHFHGRKYRVGDLKKCYESIKFACLNSMDSTYKKALEELMRKKGITL